MNLDEALLTYRGDLISAAGRWHRASRRRRRLVLAVSALAAALVVAGAAVAADGWLLGSPAPPSVRSDFGSYSTQLGFNPKPGHAVLVASDGPYQLYATTNEQGTYCVLVSAPWKRPGPGGEGGDCVSRQTAATRFWAGVGGTAGSPGGDARGVVDGRTTDPNAVSVRFSSQDGHTVTVRVGTGGFFVAGAEIGDPCRGWDPTFVLLDSSGNQIGRARSSNQLFGRCPRSRPAPGG